MRGAKEKIANGAVIVKMEERRGKISAGCAGERIKVVSFMYLWHAWQDMAICLIGDLINFMVFNGPVGELEKVNMGRMLDGCVMMGTWRGDVT
ncbi:hypothetical protein Zmor_024630 [Zophobas morio]|uniref:Uncharacterized protein n=1 Tax=Zophobas morio TaxID=2755281 RepID=A0AA38I583_9CUCU|nr:hypothetical protein Zmor_024630 [Zophobas morio]